MPLSVSPIAADEQLPAARLLFAAAPEGEREGRAERFAELVTSGEIDPGGLLLAKRNGTPVGAALKLIEPGRGEFLLESVEGGEVRGRYSLLGLDPDLVFRATGHGCEINRTWQADREAFTTLEGHSLAELRKLVESCRIDVPAELPPSACIVGYCGYETIGLVEHAGHAAVALSCHCFDVFAGDCHGRLRKGGALSAPG